MRDASEHGGDLTAERATELTSGSAATNASSDVGAARPRFQVPEQPALPRPERLNRNALTVAAVTMGVLVIAAVVFMPPDGASTRATSGSVAADAPPPAPTFLDQPAIPAPDRMPPFTSGSRRAPDVPGTPAAPADVDAGGVVDAPNPYSVPVTAAPTPDPSVEARVAREAAHRAALEAPLFAPEAGPAQHMSRSAMDASSEYGPTGPRPAPSPASPPAVPSGAMWGRHQAFMAEAARGGPRTVPTSVDSAPGPYALQEGTLIPAVLVTEVNSDLPGAVLAQVARDVYDSRTQRAVLIPAGSRLLGTYEHQLAVGQDRLLVAWTRVIFPDGRSIALPGLETKDAAGAGGVRDRVNRHTRQVFGTAALLSLVGAAVQLSQPNGGYGLVGAYPSTGQVAAGAAGQQLAQVATQMLQRNMDVQPTIRLRQGTPFNVFVSADLSFPAPYAPGP